MAAKGQLGLEVYPAELDTEAFRAAWADWLEDRAERRLPRYTARAREMQLRRLTELGPQRAVAAIQWSIAQGYKGIFEPPAPAKAATGTKSERPAAPQKPSAWELQKRLDLCNERLEQLRSRSPGPHCDLYDFLSAAEREEYGQLVKLREATRRELLGLG